MRAQDWKVPLQGLVKRMLRPGMRKKLYMSVWSWIMFGMRSGRGAYTGLEYRWRRRGASVGFLIVRECGVCVLYAHLRQQLGHEYPAFQGVFGNTYLWCVTTILTKSGRWTRTWIGENEPVRCLDVWPIDYIRLEMKENVELEEVLASIDKSSLHF